MAGQPGFFDLSDRCEELSAAGDPLERLAAVVDFEVFRGPLVAALRRCAQGSRLSRDGRADHRRHGGAGAQAAQHRCREGRDQGRARARGVEAGEGATKGPRWSIKYSKAKVREDADPKAAEKSRGPVDLAIPMFGYKNHIGIDKAHGLIRTWGAATANVHDGARLPYLISRVIPARVSGRIRPTGRRRTRRSSPPVCSRAMSTRGANRGDPCLSGSPRPTPSVPESAPRSSMCSPARSTAWASSSAPLASPEPQSRSAWPTWSITSSASSGSRGALRPLDVKTGDRGRSRHGNQRISNPKRGSPSPRGPSCLYHNEIGRFFEVSSWPVARTQSAANQSLRNTLSYSRGPITVANYPTRPEPNTRKPQVHGACGS